MFVELWGWGGGKQIFKAVSPFVTPSWLHPRAPDCIPEPEGSCPWEKSAEPRLGLQPSCTVGRGASCPSPTWNILEGWYLGPPQPNAGAPSGPLGLAGGRAGGEKDRAACSADDGEMGSGRVLLRTGRDLRFSTPRSDLRASWLGDS